MKRKRSIELLWKVPKRGRHGPKPVCSLESVVGAAIEVADREGLEALTMSRVAKKLRVTPMALYRYVPGKDELLDLMTDTAFGLPPEASGGWRAGLTEWARAELAGFRAHPWLLETVLSRSALGPNRVAWLNAILEILSGSRLTSRQKLAVALAVDGLVRSAAQNEARLAASREWTEGFERILKMLRKDDRYRALTTVARDGGFDMPANREESSFEFGLDRLLDGIGRMVEPEAGGPARTKP